VIAIIGILVALLLPAVQAAREAARRIHCANNLKEIGIGLHNYHDSFDSFPPGKITEGNCCSTDSLVTWTISILPYIEQSDLQNRYDFDLVNEDPEQEFVRQYHVPIYVCPSEPNNRELRVPESGPGGGWGARYKYRVGSYRCVGGKSDGRGWWDNNQAGVLPPEWRGPLHAIGTLGLKTERMSSIIDGTTNTLMVGEMGTRTHPSRRTFWAYAYTSYNSSDVVAQSRTLLGDYDRCVQIGGQGGANSCKRGWGSFHAGNIIQYMLCDGSVRPISTEVDMNLLSDMATIAGGEVSQLTQ
jgi:hypothetical protein